MRKSLWTIIAFLVFVPCVKADEIFLQVTSGTFGPGGVLLPGGGQLSGNGWTANLSANVINCPVFNPIIGCSTIPPAFPTAVIGAATLVLNGVTQPQITFDALIQIIQNPIVPSGTLPANFSTPATVSDLQGCLGDPFLDTCTHFVDFVFPAAVFTIFNFGPDGSGGYTATDQVYTFGTPEPGTVAFLLVGISVVLVMARKRIGQGLQKTA